MTPPPTAPDAHPAQEPDDRCRETGTEAEAETEIDLDLEAWLLAREAELEERRFALADQFDDARLG